MTEGREQSVAGEFISFKDVGVDSLGKPFQGGSLLITTLEPDSWGKTRFKSGWQAHKKEEFGLAFNGKPEEIQELLSVLSLRPANKPDGKRIKNFEGMKPGESKLVSTIDWKSDYILTLDNRGGWPKKIVSTVEIDRGKIKGPMQRYPERRMNNYEEVYLQLNKDFSWWRSREMPAEIEEGVDWADDVILEHPVDKARIAEINPLVSPQFANEFEDHYLKSRDYAVAVELAGNVFSETIEDLTSKERQLLLLRFNDEMFRGLNSLLQPRYKEEERLFGQVITKDKYYFERLRFINQETAEVNLLAKSNVIAKHFSPSNGIAFNNLKKYLSGIKENGKDLIQAAVEVYSHELGHDRVGSNERSEIWNEWLYVIYPRDLVGTDLASKGKSGYHYRGNNRKEADKELGGAYTIQKMLNECLAAQKQRKIFKISEDDVRKSILLSAHREREFGKINFNDREYQGFGDLYNQLFGKGAFEKRLKDCDNKYYTENTGKDKPEKNLPRFGKLTEQLVDALVKKMLDEQK